MSGPARPAHFLSAPPDDPDPQRRGPCAVVHQELVLAAPHRDGGLPARLWAPAAAPSGDPDAPLPLAVLSPGLGASRRGYRFLAASWASHGVCALVLDHPGTGEAAVRGLGGVRSLLQALEQPEVWLARARDLQAALAAAPALPLPQGRVDPARLAACGHSFGAYTAELVAGAALEPDLAARAGGPLRDPRPRAFVFLSPLGYGERGLSPGGFAALDRPALLCTGTRDASLTGRPWTWRAEPFLDLPGGDQFLAVFEGARHLDFAGGTRPAPAPPGLLAALEETTLAFLRLTLLGDASARARLSGDAPPGGWPGRLEAR